MKRHNYWLPGTLALSALGLFSCNTHEKLKTEKKPNIIYILADDLRFGDISCYGQEQIQNALY